MKNTYNQHTHSYRYLNGACALALYILITLLASSQVRAQNNFREADLTLKGKPNLKCFDCKSMFNQADSDALYQCAKSLGQIELYGEAFDSMRVFCERYATVQHSNIAFLVGDGFEDCSGSAGYIKRKTKSDSMLYVAYNWLINMQPKNLDCAYYQVGIFYGLASLLDLQNLNDPNEQCNMLWNYLQLCPKDTGRMGGISSKFTDYILQIRKRQKGLEIPIDTTPFYLYTYPLKPLLSVAQEHNNPEDLIEALLQPNPTTKQTNLRLSLNKSASINVTLFDILGKDMKLLYHGALESGHQSIPLDVSGLSAGEYYVRIQYGGNTMTKKLIIQ